VAKLNIYPTTSTTLHTLYRKELKHYTRDRWLMDTDDILQSRFLHTKIKHAIADNRHNSIEHNILRLRRLKTIGKVINFNSESKNMLRRIIKPELKIMLEITDNIYTGMPIPDNNNHHNHQTILDMKKNRWLRCLTITSRQIRLLLIDSELITSTKLVTFTPDEEGSLYKNTNRLRSTQNKTNILRLIHGNVYCDERHTKFKMTEIDTCIRCFEKETIRHLLTECPYTQKVWRLLGVHTNDVKVALGTHLT
jgi:hypothetical protein